MTDSNQGKLRDEICRAVMREMEARNVTIIEAAVACMGACAVILACLPPKARETAAVELDGKLLEHANHRARQIRSGEFDDLQNRRIG